MAETSVDGRIRKDAQHNRVRILEVARKAFKAQGVEVSMDAIARQSGLGSATLYRNFPNKDALLAALLDSHHQEMMQKKEIIEVDRDSGRALDRWIDALGDWMLVYDGLSGPLRAAWSRTNSPLKSACHQVVDATEGFLRAAQESGLARPTLRGEDIFLAALAVAWATGESSSDSGTVNVIREMLKHGWATIDRA
jgi:AcrR family transcriptional regulator